jgi:MFS family permease
VYRVGTLSYTRGALLTMLFWMLWADLALQLMELLQTIVPIQLERIGASDSVIGLVRDSMQAAIILLILPIIGAQSDRHRGPLGRRRPFLLFSILPVSACLIALGYADPISQALHGLLSPLVGGLTMRAAGVFTIILFVGGFYLFNNYTLPVYQYLIADIVPKEVMGKFIGFYRAIGAISGFLFNKVLFPYVDTHIEWVYLSCTLFYAFAFLLLVWRVKEGEYPPPDTTEKRPGPVTFVKRYARLCFSNWFYWKVYLTSLFYWSAIIPFYSFGILYFKAAPKGETMTSLNMSPAELGDIRAWTFLPQLIVFPVIGILIDRYHSLRFLITGFWSMASCFIIAVFLAYAQPHINPVKSANDRVLVTVCDSRTDGDGRPERLERVMAVKDIQAIGENELTKVPADAPAGTRKFFEDKYYSPAPAWAFWWWLAMMIALAIIQLSYLAMQPALFPRETYGQFFSANQWVFCIGMLLAPIICGLLLDLFQDYRMVFIWSSTFFILAALMSVSIFRHWKRLGGDEHYTPPQTGMDLKM